MRILSDEEIVKLGEIIHYLLRETQKLKDGEAHPSTCGCRQCDHDSEILRYYGELFE